MSAERVTVSRVRRGVVVRSLGKLGGLAALTGRAPSNLSRTLKTMERYGLVELRRNGRHLQPVAHVAEFVIRAA